jgi:hypothetical protein
LEALTHCPGTKLRRSVVRKRELVAEDSPAPALSVAEMKRNSWRSILNEAVRVRLRGSHCHRRQPREYDGWQTAGVVRIRGQSANKDLTDLRVGTAVFFYRPMLRSAVLFDVKSKQIKDTQVLFADCEKTFAIVGFDWPKHRCLDPVKIVTDIGDDNRFAHVAVSHAGLRFNRCGCSDLKLPYRQDIDRPLPIGACRTCCEDLSALKFGIR